MESNMQTTEQTTQPATFWQILRPAVVSLFLFTVITGLFYPALITGIARVFFPYQAGGSLIKTKDGTILGSELIGQQFTKPEYFWGRLSATTIPYDASSSSGSNYGPLNPALIGPTGAIAAQVKAYHDAEKAAHVDSTKPVPVDLVTASASGLDPHISPAGALYQASRVAALRGVSEEKMRGLVDECTEGRSLGFLGEPRVNVLRLNLALDERFPLPAAKR